jgi:hypothetical protein
MRPLLLLSACVLPCACTPNATWQDLTGKGRSDEQRKADYQACYETSGFRPDGTWAVSFNESIEELGECLLERGWKSSSMGTPRTKRDGGAWRWAPSAR